MKKLFAVLTLFAFGLTADPRLNQIITISAGTPVHLSSTHLYVTDVTFQMATAASGGIGYVCVVPFATTPAGACATAGQLAVELQAGTATVPGTPFTMTASQKQGPGIDLGTVWVDGSHTADSMIVSYNQQN